MKSQPTPRCDALAREHQRIMAGVSGAGVVQDWIALAQQLERELSQHSKSVPSDHRCSRFAQQIVCVECGKPQSIYEVLGSPSESVCQPHKPVPSEDPMERDDCERCERGTKPCSCECTSAGSSE